LQNKKQEEYFKNKLGTLEDKLTAKMMYYSLSSTSSKMVLLFLSLAALCSVTAANLTKRRADFPFEQLEEKVDILRKSCISTLQVQNVLTANKMDCNTGLGAMDNFCSN
jgi:hypothetical protein